jgi:hypothetical protein
LNQLTERLKATYGSPHILAFQPLPGGSCNVSMPLPSIPTGQSDDPAVDDPQHFKTLS